jgi:large subunit ribosomal protein L13
MKDFKTYLPSKNDIRREWHLVDATGETLGRLASRISRTLQGKDKPVYTPHLLTGDYVVVINAAKIKVTGRKLEQKTYYRHSGYTGNLKSVVLKDLMSTYPERAIQFAVKGMLPDNKLARTMLKRLKIYANDQHPHSAHLTENDPGR